MKSDSEIALEVENAILRAQRDELAGALREVASWSQQLQDDVEARGHGVAMWRGCVAIARAALAKLEGADG